MATSTTTTVTSGNKTTSTTTTNDKPGEAFVWSKKRKRWVRPAMPSSTVDANGNTIEYAWDNNKGWVSNASSASAYKLPLAIINGDPELTKLFNDAWADQKAGKMWSPDQFKIKLEATKWYSTHSESWRNYYTLSNDPAQKGEFDRQVAKSKTTVSDLASQMGASLTKEQLDELTTTSLQGGMNESETRKLISHYISFTGKTDQEIVGSLFGQAGSDEDTLRDWAKKNGVTVSNDWVLQQVQGIASGDFDTNKSKDYITNLAKQQYSAFADKIDASTTAEDVSQSYRQILSNDLNIPIEQIDFNNKFLKDAMTKTDANGKPINMQDFQTTIRQSDDWANTTHAQNAVANVTNSILSRFGLL